jgi:antitoxin MazE
LRVRHDEQPAEGEGLATVEGAQYGRLIVDTTGEAGMKTKVQRWGNSLAVRIPKAFAEEVGLANDSPVEMRLFQGGLIVEPSPLWEPTLDELLEGVTDSNLHGEVDTGPAQGSEIW